MEVRCMAYPGDLPQLVRFYEADDYALVPGVVYSTSGRFIPGVFGAGNGEESGPVSTGYIVINNLVIGIASAFIVGVGWVPAGHTTIVEVLTGSFIRRYWVGYDDVAFGGTPSEHKRIFVIPWSARLGDFYRDLVERLGV
jgi:hypothetical protein